MGNVVSFERWLSTLEPPRDVGVTLGPSSEPITFRVLVADDDEWTRHLLRSYLVTEGVEVETVRNGEEAIGRFIATQPDIVFLDIEMPGRTGLEVLGIIREHTADTAVVITTACGTDHVVATVLRRGADDYLRKPFGRGELQAVLDRTIARVLLTRQSAALRQRVLERQRRMEELGRAAVLAELLPPPPPRLQDFELAAACLPARHLAGDFYDWRQRPDGGLSITVGDVMGKGLPAVLLMATVRGVLRAVAKDSPPADAVQRTAAVLEDDLARAGAFVTLFHAHVDVTSGELRYVDAGHGYALLRRADGRVEQLERWHLPIGVDQGERYREGCVRLDPGDLLLIYSDGVIEACPERFSHGDAIAALAGCGSDAAGIVSAVMAELAHVKPLPDDFTLLAVRRNPAPEA